jgi:hypothetical protein
MPRVAYSIGQDDQLRLEVFVGPDAATLVGSTAAGQSSPKPVHAHAVIDTGSNVTAVSPHLLRQVGAVRHRQSTSTSVSGSTVVVLYYVSVGIPAGGALPAPIVLNPRLLVMELPNPIPGADVLVGMDILLGCQLLVDGPNRSYTLDV